MDYLIVQNQTTVLVGPMPWRPRYFQSEFNDLYDNGDLTTPYTVSQTDPNSYINVGDGIEIYPVSSYVTPDYNSMYQELAGPFWTFDNTSTFSASASFNIIDNTNIGIIQGNLMGVAAQERYRREQLGTTATVTTSSVVINIATDRDNRLQYLYLLESVENSPNKTINFKSDQGFLVLGVNDMQAIVSAVCDYVQAQFDWEFEIQQQISSATSVGSLQAIEILPPPSTPSI